MKKMQNWQENIPMTKDKFWEVINNARAIAPALEGEPLRESLYKQLLTLFPDELVGFDCAWQEYRRIANSPQLIASACIINGGTSDDRFDYFKNWLILQGQYVFRQALKDPDALAEFKIPFDDTEWEDCGYLTSLAFVGRALPTYFAQEGIAKELRRKYPALLQAPGALDVEIMRVLLYPNREQEQAFDRYLLGLEVQHYIDISGLDSYDKFYLEHISCRWEWDYLRESIREETPQPRQGKLSPDIASTLPKLWKKRLGGAGKKESLVGLAAAAACCMVGGAGGGLPLAAGHENSGSVGCAEQRTGRAVCVGVGQRQPAIFAGVYSDLCGSGYRGSYRSEEHPPRRGAWLGGMGRCVPLE